MKRVAIILIILLILGGVVFYFGWVQMSIPAGGYAVIFTRTGGWEDEAVEAGTFVWRWQRLLPTNLELFVFEPGEHVTDARVSGELPSGTAIETLLEDVPDFGYEVRISVASRIRPDRLVALARDRDVRPDEIDSFYETLDAQVSELTKEAVVGLIEDQTDRLSLSDAFPAIRESVRSRLERSLSDVEILAVDPRQIRLPDVELYTTARREANRVLEARGAALEQAAASLAQTQVESDRELLLLERYGEILDRYPVLLEYFRVGQEIGGDPLNLEELIPQRDE